MFTDKQQEIANRILKDIAAQENYVWESDYMSILRMEYSQNYHDCDYVLQTLISDYRLIERYGSGFLKLTPEGMDAAGKKFTSTVKSEERLKKVKRWNEYITLVNGVCTLIGMLLGSGFTLIVQWLLKAI